MFKEYYYLTKPGIIKGNLLTAAAGFLFASQGSINLYLLLLTLLGIACIIAAGCVFNNILDRKIDAKMDRTKNRSLATGAIPVRNAALYGSVLALTGFSILIVFTNTTTVGVGIVGIISYVVLYGFVKRHSVFGTEAGTISGATPILAGYTAVTGSIDIMALTLFLIMVVWQMPHFYAIAIFRSKEYAAAKIPVISVVKGTAAVKPRLVLYVILFSVVATLPFILGYAGALYGAMLAGGGLFWLYRCIKNYTTENSFAWAKSSFGTSLVVLLIFCAALSADSFLP